MKGYTVAGAILGVLIAAICFLPVLESGMMGDDLANYQTKTTDPARDAQSAYDLAKKGIVHWKGLGRYAPLSLIWEELVFKHTRSVQEYKIFQFLMNLFAAGVFFLMLRALRYKTPPLIILLCLCAVVQYRVFYHDAYTSYNAMYQLLAIFLFAAVAFFALAIRNGKNIFVIAALLCSAGALFTSEVGLLFFPLLIAASIYLRLPLRQGVKCLLPFAGMVGAYLGYIAWLRAHIAVPEYNGLLVSYHLKPMVGLYLKQLCGSLPLGAIGNDSGWRESIMPQLKLVSSLTCLAVIVIAGIYSWMRPAMSVATNHQASYHDWLLPLVLVVVPPMFLVPSAKYQAEVQWDSPYLPVYLQAFGSAWLLAMMVNLFRLMAGKVASIPAYVLVAAVAMLTFLHNKAVVAARQYSLSFPANAFFESVKGGLLDGCPQAVVIKHDSYWYSPETSQDVFRHVTGKEYRVYASDTAAAAVSSQYCRIEVLAGNPVHIVVSEVSPAGKPGLRILRDRCIPCNISVLLPADEKSR